LGGGAGRGGVDLPGLGFPLSAGCALGLSRVPAGGAGGAGGGAQGDGGGTAAASYALTSLGAEEADARRLGELLLSRWEVENRSFWVRDVLLHGQRSYLEDACQVRGVGAQVLAVLRAFLVSLLYRRGVRKKKAALETFSFHPLSPLGSWGSMRYNGQVCYEVGMVARV